MVALLLVVLSLLIHLLVVFDEVRLVAHGQVGALCFIFCCGTLYNGESQCLKTAQHLLKPTISYVIL